MTELRVASHVHSDWSYDGQWSLHQLAEGFGRRGYDAVLMAEHDRGFDAARHARFRAACVHASTPRTLLVAGIEYSDPTNTVHVPVWGDIPFLGEGRDTSDLLRDARAHDAVAVLAHPGRRDALRRLDAADLDLLSGIELWNRKYDGYAPNRGVAELAASRPRLTPFVSLDFHSARQFHPLAMMVTIDGEPSEASLCAAMRAGTVRATAFSLPALSLARGPVWPAICGLERVRHGIAVPVRRLRARRRAGQGRAA